MPEAEAKAKTKTTASATRVRLKVGRVTDRASHSPGDEIDDSPKEASRMIAADQCDYVSGAKPQTPKATRDDATG